MSAAFEPGNTVNDYKSLTWGIRTGEIISIQDGKAFIKDTSKGGGYWESEVKFLKKVVDTVN